jgi:hypothetical protein
MTQAKTDKRWRGDLEEKVPSFSVYGDFNSN